LEEAMLPNIFQQAKSEKNNSLKQLESILFAEIEAVTNDSPLPRRR
jgi:hypothetical protein